MWRFDRAPWRHLTRVPAKMERRRAEFLKARTGRQLMRMAERWKLMRPAERMERPQEEAYLRTWLELAPKFGVAHRVLQESFRDRRPTNMLVVGHTESFVGAARDIWPALKKVIAIEKTEERKAAAQFVLDDDVRNLAFRTSLLDIARAGEDSFEGGFGTYDLVVAAWHLSELPEKERDTVLAILWGAVKKDGTLIIVEDKTQGGLLALTRARLVSPQSHSSAEERGHVVAPCPHDGICPLWDPNTQKLGCFFKQSHLRALEGPPARSTRSKTLGRVIRTNHGAELFVYVAIQKARRVPPAARHREARVTETPGKHGGHVIVELCTSDATKETITLTKARFDKAGLDFKDARKLTWGSRLVFSDQLLLDKVRPRLMIIDGLPQRVADDDDKVEAAEDPNARFMRDEGAVSREKRARRLALRRAQLATGVVVVDNPKKRGKPAVTLEEALDVETKLSTFAQNPPETALERAQLNLVRQRARRVLKYGAGGVPVFKSKKRRYKGRQPAPQNELPRRGGRGGGGGGDDDDDGGDGPRGGY